ncbi:MAG: ABC transporter substrate-binding protein [Desulfobacterales bacterium]|nr:ABC transporter substrate-binding protein [Desulfobacterales bacterium]
MIIQRSSSTFLLALSVAILFCTGGCGESLYKDLRPVTYRLKWLINTSVAGGLYADAHGIFADHGLRVTIKEGGPERDSIKELELGHAQFGVASADQVIRAVSKGAPVVVIAQLFQVNPLQWIYRPEKTCIDTVQDLKGKTIGVTYGGNDETIMRALLTKWKIKNKDVKLFSVRYDYTPFYDGEVDLWPVYQNAEGMVIGEKLRKAGERAGFFNPDDFGARFVANSVITTERMLKERSDIVHKFTKALLQGWREALNPANCGKAVKTICRFDKDTPVHIIRKQLQATRILMKPSPEVEIGRIDTKAWIETERIMLEQKLIARRISVKRILRHYAQIASR